MFVGNHPLVGVYVTASISAESLSLSEVILGVAGPQAAALAEFLSPFNFRYVREVMQVWQTTRLWKLTSV